jgi:hypothetical protein
MESYEMRQKQNGFAKGNKWPHPRVEHKEELDCRRGNKLVAG